MERRKHPRLQTNLPVLMTTLPRGRSVEACVLLDLSEGGLRLRSSAPLAVNAAVRIEADDLLLLGEVTRCDAEGGAYSVGIQLSHTDADLEQLNRAPGSETQPVPATHEV